MFGSINVVSSKPSSDRKEKKAKKDKKSRKKEKKAKKDKRSRHRRSSDSDSDASSCSSRGAAPAPAESAEAVMLKRKREDDAMWDSLLGGGAPPPVQTSDEAAAAGGGASDVYQGKDWFKDRHADRLRKKPVDAADSLRAGLRGHFTRSATQDSSANQSMLAAAASVEIPPSTLMRELVDAEGRWEGVFVPPHHRDETTLEAWRALLDKMKDQGDAKRRRLDKPDKAATPSAASGGGYEGTSMAQLLAESRAERFGGGKDRKERSLRETMGNGCQISYGSERFSKESVISMGERTMLTLPVYSALCEGQCYITTIERRLCELDFEEDEQVEVRNFKKCLIAKAAAQGKQMVFSEFSNPSARRQTYIDCVPVDNEDWGDIEMFFYKALLESEDEFIQQHKPVISTKGKLLKQCLAPNIPYYHVSFGLDGGYAHVVADPKRFPRYLTNDILGPIIGAGLDGRLSAAQRERLLGADARKAFRAAWDTYDWTKMLDQQEVASEDEGSRRGDDDEDQPAQPPSSTAQ